MASIQSRVMELMIRRMNLFNYDRANLQALRLRMDRLSARAPGGSKVEVKPVQAGTVPGEWLIPPGAPPDRAVLYLHGGAWFLGSPRSHRAFVSRLAQAGGFRALVIDYRLAPEHPFPAGLEDCLAAYEWLQQNGIPPHKMVVAGDSAGGNLALALLVMLRDTGKPLPAGAVALSPATDLAGTGASQQTRRQLDPFFAKTSVSSVVPDYITVHDPCHPWISPLYADLHGLPPLLIHAGDHEILRDDAVRFGEKAAAAGVDVKTVVWPGMFHVFQMFDPIVPEAKKANEEIVGFVAERMRVESRE